jgi:hypothetical protein
MAYAQRSDLYLYGVPRGALVAPGLRTSVAPAGSSITIAGHGFETNDALVLRADPGATLPAPLVDGTTYYAIRIDDATLSLAPAPSGGAITMTTGLVGTMTRSPSLDAAIQAELNDASHVVDDKVPHLVPLPQPYPTRVIAITARLAAYNILCLIGRRNDATLALKLDALADLNRYAQGLAMQDANALQPEQMAMGSMGDGVEEDLIP